MGDETLVKVEYKVSLQCRAGIGEMPQHELWFGKHVGARCKHVHMPQ